MIIISRRTDTMGLLAKILGALSGVDMNGICLDVRRPFWEIAGKTDFSSLFAALPDLLPSDCFLYFEGGSPSGGLLKFLEERKMPERTHVAPGTIWPKPDAFHIPATSATLNSLGELMHCSAYPELAIHFHVYLGQSVLLEWHDAFTEPMLLSGKFSEPQVRAFADRLHMSCKKGVDPGASPNAVPPHR